ncbi:septum formation initiator family protein [Phytomonospora sp. NPDC050363]|uniref:FtsB family cell division protein n=1 Tax=Phytomonospora sp. NPDC050363 TaxID=3155642 RepID=UPI0033F0B5DA
MSARTAILALVLSALALAYAYPVRTYFGQRAEIERLQAEQSEQRERISELEAERAKWEDDDYIATQARIHLLLVRPGEKPLIIISDPEGAAKDAGEPYEPPATESGNWYEELLSSVDGADGAG